MKSSSVACGCIVAVLLWAIPLGAQLYFYPSGPAPRAVSTSAEATVVVPAHRVALTVSVCEIAPSAAEAGASHAAVLAHVTDAIKELGLGEGPLPATSYSISREENWDTGEITGYEACSGLQLEVADPKALGTVVDRLLAAGASEVSGINFRAEDPEGTRMRAIERAFQLAMDEAQALAELSGAELGQVLDVSTRSKATTTQYSEEVVVTGSVVAETKIPVPEVKIKADVSVRWELLPIAPD